MVFHGGFMVSHKIWKVCVCHDEKNPKKYQSITINYKKKFQVTHPNKQQEVFTSKIPISHTRGDPESRHFSPFSQSLLCEHFMCESAKVGRPSFLVGSNPERTTTVWSILLKPLSFDFFGLVSSKEDVSSRVGLASKSRFLSKRLARPVNPLENVC